MNDLVLLEYSPEQGWFHYNSMPPSHEPNTNSYFSVAVEKYDVVYRFLDSIDRNKRYSIDEVRDMWSQFSSANEPSEFSEIEQELINSIQI